MTQAEALAILESGRSALLTGAAGSGKTFLLNRFIARAKKSNRNVAVTATTGLAATHLNGATVHSWSGIGIHDELPPGHIRGLSEQRRKIIISADVLVIDEISMLHDYRLDMIEQVVRDVRGVDKVFGGLQVILCGDFFQLPPVNRRDSREGGFIVGSRAWRDGEFSVLYLEEQHRQRGDDGFVEILNALRGNSLDDSHVAKLTSRIGARQNLPITPTGLHTTNIDVDGINQTHLEQLKGESKEYLLTHSGKARYVESLKRSCLAQEQLRLKTGALVMFIRNSQDKKYVNGTLGVVNSFEDDTNFPIVKLSNGRQITVKPETWELRDGEIRRAQLTQLPLRLAWAITVHKSQGMTLDAADIDLRRAFVPGMGYVALSRVRRLEDLTLSGLNHTALQVSPEALEIDAQLRSASEFALRENAAILPGAQGRWDSLDEGIEKISSKQRPTTEWSDKLGKMRESYPNAYRPWSKDDDTKLKAMFDSGNGLKELTYEFGRQPGSIRSRLRKHFGEDLVIRS